jgi:hypothetical protein
MKEFMHGISTLLEAIGVVCIVAGFLLALVKKRHPATPARIPGGLPVRA